MKFLIFLLLASCGSYVSSLHNQIDREESGVNGDRERGDPYGIYREQGFKRRRQDRRPVVNPLTRQQAYQVAPENNSDILPSVKREYRPTNMRHTARDFVDSDNGGSLWASNQTASSLYGSENVKKAGDIVIINVLDNLRGQISTELKRAFADDAKAANPQAVPSSNAAAPTPEGGAQPGGSGKPGEKQEEHLDKVYDKISGVIVEEISKDYILVRGKKEVFFRKEKRFIEVQALVPRRDVGDNDTVNSDRILESRVFILR